MFSIHKYDFVKLCQQNNKTLEECRGCIIGRNAGNPNLYDIDETSPFYPAKRIIDVIKNYSATTTTTTNQPAEQPKDNTYKAKSGDYFKFSNRQ